MYDPKQSEDIRRGTPRFPFEYYYISTTHPRYVMNYHWHLEYEIIRIVEGSFLVTLDENTFTAHKNDLIFVNSGTLHGGIPSDCVYECVVFEGNYFLKYSPVCADLIQSLLHREILVQSRFDAGQPSVLKAANDIFDAMHDRRPGYELVVIGQFYHFFGEILGSRYYTASSSFGKRDYRRVSQLKNVLEYIRTHYADPELTLNDLSMAAGMSPKYFCSFFSHMLNQSPMNYLNHYRLDQASYEISTTEDSITDIALRNGFNDLSYFIRTFRKYKGITPGKYKKGR